MDHEIREHFPGRRGESPVRKSQHEDNELQRTPIKANRVIELSPLKAMRIGKVTGIRSEPRPGLRQRANSSGAGPTMTPRALDREEDPIPDKAGGLRFRRPSFSPPFRKRETITYFSPSSITDPLIRRRESSRRDTMQRPRSRYIIPADHWFKVVWDVFTVIFAVAYIHKTHEKIRDRDFEILSSPFKVFCDVWFLLDILLNFVSERKTAEGELLSDYRSICAKYLTSWFAIDALSLFPWETLYIQPIIDIQNRRGPFQKLFFRSRAVVRVFIKRLRGRHFRWFGQVAKRTKHHGVGSARLLRLLIKYLPKYILFYKNMKGVVVVRALRQFHWLKRFTSGRGKNEGQTESLSKDEYDDDISSSQSGEEGLRQVRLVFEEDWERVEDDGVPL